MSGPCLPVAPAAPLARRSCQARVAWGTRVVTVGGDAPRAMVTVDFPSSPDQTLVTGEDQGTVVFAGLDPGTHTVTCTAVDSHGNTASGGYNAADVPVKSIIGFLKHLGITVNGTFVRVIGRHAIRSGDLILMGQQLFRAEY